VNDVYCADTSCSCVRDVAARTYPELVERLKETCGIELRLDYFSDTYQLEDALAEGTYDGAICKPWLAFRTQEASGAKWLRVADLLDPQNNQWLRGSFIVPVDSPIRTMEDISGKRLAIGESDGYEKHHAALRTLRELRIVPKMILQSASCGENVGLLQDGKADAAVISDYALRADCAVDYASPEDFRILGRTDPIPLTSFLIDTNRVSVEMAERLKRGLLRVSGPGAPHTLMGNGFVEPAPWTP